MSKQLVWTPYEISRLMIAVTCCLCLVIIIGSCIALIATNKLDPNSVGSIISVSAGSGMIGFALIIFWILKKVLESGDQSSDPK